VLAYYLWAWMKVGRDPPAGVIVPRWDAPEGISPALANYIDKRVFAAGLGCVLGRRPEPGRQGPGRTRRSRRRPDHPPHAGAGAGGLPVGEAAILRYLGPSGDTLTVDKANGMRVQATGTAFRGAIEKEHRDKFYRHNRLYAIGGVMLSVALLAWC
jgi:hypothetical protein